MSNSADPTTLRLLIADDHQLFRRGLRQLCEINGKFTVVAEAENGAQAVALVRQHQPDVTLMDVRMPELTGVDAVREILRENPQARILVLTMYTQDHYVINALRAGARGYLLKNCSEDLLFTAIRAVQRGETWLDSTITAPVVAHLLTSNDSERPLTEAELEIIRLVAHGKDNEAIASQLHLSSGTVANRLRGVYAKLGVGNRTEAALYALRQGWASLDPED